MFRLFQSDTGFRGRSLKRDADTDRNAVKSVADAINLVLEQAERDLLAFQQRYRRFAELFQALEVPIKTTRRLRGEDKTDRPRK